MFRTAHTQPDTADGAAPVRTRSGDRRPGLPWWQATAVSVVSAAGVNLLIFLAGRLAGASFVVVDGGVPVPVSATDVAVSSVVPMAVGMVLAILLARWWLGAYRLAQVIGAGLALVTVAGSVLADTDGGTSLALSLMHVVVAVTVVLGLAAARRWALAGNQPVRVSAER